MRISDWSSDVCSSDLAGTHRAGHRIELRIMRARRFGETRRRGGEFIPEPIEVDSLPASDQSLHVRPAEAEMPEQRALQYLFPRTQIGSASCRERGCPYV